METKMSTGNYDVIGVVRNINGAADVDMRQRMVPSTNAMELAHELFTSASALKPQYVIVPMVFPGKTHGLWRIGQEVVTVPAVFPVGAGLMTHGMARECALAAAKMFMASSGRIGTTAYVIIDPDMRAAVFED